MSFNDVSPTRIITYVYTYLFDDYLREEAPATYVYVSEIENYLLEQSDGWIPPTSTSYTYEIEFIDYLTEQENI